MNHEDLRNTLMTLHMQLASAGEIDKETQAMLQIVTSDIQRLLEPNATGAVVEESSNTLAERLRTTLIEFEARHPHVERAHSVYTNMANMLMAPSVETHYHVVGGGDDGSWR